MIDADSWWQRYADIDSTFSTLEAIIHMLLNSVAKLTLSGMRVRAATPKINGGVDASLWGSTTRHWQRRRGFLVFKFDFPFRSLLTVRCYCCPPWLEMCGVSVAECPAPAGKGCLAPPFRHFGQGGALNTITIFTIVMESTEARLKFRIFPHAASVDGSDLVRKRMSTLFCIVVG